MNLAELNCISQTNSRITAGGIASLVWYQVQIDLPFWGAIIISDPIARGEVWHISGGKDQFGLANGNGPQRRRFRRIRFAAES